MSGLLYQRTTSVIIYSVSISWLITLQRQEPTLYYFNSLYAFLTVLLMWKYYFKRGWISINLAGPNLLFLFSNGTDPELCGIGRVASWIWAKAMNFKYDAAKATDVIDHIKTSGRSLQCPGKLIINDIRTTLPSASTLSMIIRKSLYIPNALWWGNKPNPHQEESVRRAHRPFN